MSFAIHESPEIANTKRSWLKMNLTYQDRLYMQSIMHGLEESGTVRIKPENGTFSESQIRAAAELVRHGKIKLSVFGSGSQTGFLCRPGTEFKRPNEPLKVTYTPNRSNR